MTAHIPTKTLVAAAAAIAARNRQVEEFTTAAGSATHEAPIASGVTKEEAAQTTQTAARAALTVAQATIAEADATNSTT